MQHPHCPQLMVLKRPVSNCFDSLHAKTMIVIVVINGGCHSSHNELVICIISSIQHQSNSLSNRISWLGHICTSLNSVAMNGVKGCVELLVEFATYKPAVYGFAQRDICTVHNMHRARSKQWVPPS